MKQVYEIISDEDSDGWLIESDTTTIKLSGYDEAKTELVCDALNTHAMTTEYDLAVLPELVEVCSEILSYNYSESFDGYEIGEGTYENLRSTLDRFKRRGE